MEISVVGLGWSETKYNTNTVLPFTVLPLLKRSITSLHSTPLHGERMNRPAANFFFPQSQQIAEDPAPNRAICHTLQSFYTRATHIPRFFSWDVQRKSSRSLSTPPSWHLFGLAPA